MQLYKNKWILLIFSMAFLKPAGFDIYGMNNINLVFNIIRGIAIIVVLTEYFIIRKKVSIFIFIEIILFNIIGFSSLINGSDIIKYLMWSISILGFTCMIERGLNYDAKKLIEVLFFCYLILAVSNFYLQMKYYGWGIDGENGYIGYSFLSSVNSTASYVFPGFVVAKLYSDLRGKMLTFSAVILILCFTLSTITVWSATSLMGIFFILIYILFIYGKRYEKYINFKILIIVAIAIVVGIVFFRLQYYFEYIIVDILHKDLNMTGRTYFWDLGIDWFLKSPILGWGSDFKAQGTIIDNGIIQFLCQTGVIGFTTLLILMIISLKKLILNPKHSSCIYFISFVIFTIFIMSIAESWFIFAGFYIILTFCNNMTSVDKTIKSNNLYNKKLNKYYSK